MRVPPLPDIFLPAIGFAILLFLLVSIILPGVFIWAGFKLVGRERGIVQCGIANFAAFLIASIVTFLLAFTPLVLFSPLIFFAAYLYILKVLLDVSFIEALAATVIAAIIIFVAALVIHLLFGMWMVSFLPRPPAVMHF